MKRMKENKAGNYIPLEFAEEIMDVLDEHDLDPEFAKGAACILAYVACPKDSDMHGAPFERFLENGLRGCEEPPAEVMSAAHAVIDELKKHGIEVVEAHIVKVAE